MSYLEPILTVVIAVLGCGLLLGQRRAGKLLRWGGLAGLFLATWPPIAWVAAGALEWQYPVGDKPRGMEAEAIVVLGEAVYAPNPPEPFALPGWNTYLRAQHAAWLYKNWRQVPVVVSGGASQAGAKVVAEQLKRVLEGEGVPGPMIWEEKKSTSTYLNAAFTSRMLREKGIGRIVLVTQAYHMPRAERCFRKEGLAVTPSPCAYRTLDFQAVWPEFLPSAAAVRSLEDSLHEGVGLLWYWLTGKI